jgi:hypothetical protein
MQLHSDLSSQTYLQLTVASRYVAAFFKFQTECTGGVGALQIRQSLLTRFD